MVMRTKLLYLVVGFGLCLMLAGADRRAEPTDLPLKTGTVIKKGDAQMPIVERCLRWLKSDGEPDTVRLLETVEAENYVLWKTMVKEYRSSPPRVRLGYDFVNTDELKTIYMEADCPIAEPTPAPGT